MNNTKYRAILPVLAIYLISACSQGVVDSPKINTSLAVKPNLVSAIEVGMTYEEVRTLIGKPKGVKSINCSIAGGVQHTCHQTWLYERNTVTFVDGFVQGYQ